MKNILRVAAITALIFLPTSGKSEISLGTILGIAKTIGNIIFGETTVTPSYRIYTYDDSSNYLNSGGDFNKVRRKLRYEVVTGNYYYYSYDELSPFPPSTSNGPLSIPKIELKNFSCDGTTPISSTFRVATSYTVMLTCTITSSGMAPPNGPYECCLKTAGTELPYSCTDTNYGGSREFRKAFQVQPYGFVTGRVGVPNYELAFPFQCWAGHPYLY